MKIQSYKARIKGNTIIWPEGTPPIFQDGLSHDMLVTFIPSDVPNPDEWIKEHGEDHKDEILLALNTF